MEMAQYPLIAALAWLLCEGLKALRVNTAWLPFCAAVFGTAAAVTAHFFCPSLVGGASLPVACVAGAVSGLAATGANEAVKKLLHTAHVAVTAKGVTEGGSAHNESDSDKEA